MAQIEVTGNAGKDAELKFINGSKGDFAIANFSIAETPREYKNGAWTEGETVWWRVSATGETAEWLADMELKGQKLFVRGELRHFEYEKDGVQKSGLEIKAKTVGLIGTPKRKTTKPAEEVIGWD